MKHFDDRVPVMLELGLSPDAIPFLKEYIQFLWDANKQLNLISRKMTYEELIDNHVIDCLLPLKKIPTDIKAIADLGSGGGLPGVIYAIQFPDIQFHLYEKSNLKRGFLDECAHFAPNLKTHAEISKEMPHVQLIVARAFKPIDVMLEMTQKYYENGGKYFLLKARKEKIEVEIADAKKKFPNLEVRLEPLKSPVLDVERHLVWI